MALICSVDFRIFLLLPESDAVFIDGIALSDRLQTVHIGARQVIGERVEEIFLLGLGQGIGGMRSWYDVSNKLCRGDREGSSLSSGVFLYAFSTTLRSDVFPAYDAGAFELEFTNALPCYRRS